MTRPDDGKPKFSPVLQISSNLTHAYELHGLQFDQKSRNVLQFIATNHVKI